MNHIRTKLIVAGVVVALAMGYLAFAGVKKGWVYYVEVDAFRSDPQYRDQRVRLAGSVSDQNLLVNAAGLTAQFDLLGQKERVRVAYHGVIPEMFKAGSSVVVEGTADATGVFQSDLMLTKCASKYEARVKHPEQGSEVRDQPDKARSATHD